MTAVWLACGSNSDGQLCVTRDEDIAAFDPVDCSGKCDDGSNLQILAAGERCTLLSVLKLGPGGTLQILRAGSWDTAERADGLPVSPVGKLSLVRGLPAAVSVMSVACSWGHAALVTSCGGLWTTGSGEAGQLGAGAATRSTADWLPVAHPSGEAWTTVACSRSFTIALSGPSREHADASETAGAAARPGCRSVWAWGSTRHGVLGLSPHDLRDLRPKSDSSCGLSDPEAAEAAAEAALPPIVWKPALVSAVSKLLAEQPSVPQPTAVAVGASHTALLCDDGSVITFGSNRYGQCGRPGVPAHAGHAPEPAAASDTGSVSRAPEPATAVGGDAGAAEAVEIRTGGSAGAAKPAVKLRRPRDPPAPPLPPGFVAGFGCGPAAVAASRACSSAREGTAGVVAGQLQLRATAISSGWSHVAVVAAAVPLADGSDGSSGGGDGSSSPARIAEHTHGVLPPRAAAPSMPAASASLPRVLTWGRGDMGQLGRPIAPGTRFDWMPTPVQLQHCSRSSRACAETAAEAAVGSLASAAAFDEASSRLHGRSAPGPAITTVACGSEHTLAAASCGCLWSWGWNEHGNCGLGSPDRHDAGTLAAGLAPVAQAARAEPEAEGGGRELRGPLGAAAGPAIADGAAAGDRSIVSVPVQVPGFGCGCAAGEACPAPAAAGVGAHACAGSTPIGPGRQCQRFARKVICGGAASFVLAGST